ncbi:TonB-dependent receptor domain-containing protein [Sphingomonas sp.]|uniref:TonB-dependent receptor domain-containing protein n=1 Tax=Sphingomonas sp. TaxID=28214 RepID=UPI003CC69A19
MLAPPAWAQTAAPAPIQPAPAPETAAASTTRTFLPADFARFAPRTAYDMLAQVPGFTIREVDDDQRGLGQATENVLINGRREANKSGGAAATLRQTPAPLVERIEIVDAASLGVAGLTGQVANVVLRPARGATGQFAWDPGFRAHFTHPDLFGGSISMTGRRGPVAYTVSLTDDANRGGFGGPEIVTAPDGTLIERREERFHNESDMVTLRTKFGIDGPGSSLAHLELAVTPYRNRGYDGERRLRPDGNNRFRLTQNHLSGAYYDINADAEAALGPGRLKLIGVRHVDHEPVIQTQTSSYDSGAPTEGIRFERRSLIQEMVARGEYSWTTGHNAWQLSLERAYNALDQRGALATLSTTGVFVPTPFPDGSGQVEETRYEATGTLSRPLTPSLDLQLVAGAEQSRLARVDGDVPARRFFRPKGSISLGWRPAAGWDASLKLSRKVGQISFYDFLDQPNLQQDRQNAGNAELVPPQSWEVEAEGGHDLGRWGKARLRVFGRRTTDIIDIIPVGATGEGVGNLPHASSIGAETTATLQGEPIGWAGAKLDWTIGFEATRVRDPLTGEMRPISGTRDGYADISFRRDVPHSAIAWGGELNFSHYAHKYRLSEVYWPREGPVFDSLFIEHKNVRGLTVRLQADDLLNARHRLDRAVYTGRRTVAPLSYRLHADELIGPIFTLGVSGSF